MSRTALRPGLPPPPLRIAALPIDERGYPIPWFVEYIDGKPDFRVAGGDKRYQAVRYGKCWVCGEPMGAIKAFVAGPMCGVNRTSSEPAAHRECAQWSVKACPFMLLPRAVRRDANLPTDVLAPAPGQMIERNPGAVMIWLTRSYGVFKDRAGGWLIEMGEPISVEWYREGRFATRAEVLESIQSGLPILAAQCETPEEIAKLETMATAFMPWLPKE